MKNRPEILIIEDDLSLQETLHSVLEERGAVTAVSSCTEAANVLCKQNFDLIIADYRLADGNGVDLFRSIKESTTNKGVPMILMTGFATKDIAIEAIDLGVVALVEKPFSLEKLLQTYDKVMKTSAVEDLLLDHELRSAVVDGKHIELTAIEFKILAALMENKNRQLQRHYLEQTVWGSEAKISKNTLDTHLYNIKKKMPFLRDKIRTIHGSGLIYYP